jgi:transposase InsO family protein
LEEFIQFNRKPKAMQTDNGQHMISAKFIGWAESRDIEQRHVRTGKSDQNALNEWFACSMPE